MKILVLILILSSVLFSYEVKFTKLNDKVWIHTSYLEYQGNLIPANGLIIEEESTITLVDAGADPDQGKQIVDFIKKTFNKEVGQLIISHEHSDRNGGEAAINPMIRINFYEIFTKIVGGMLPKDGKELKINFGGLNLFDATPTYSILYPGHGHSKDNIIVYSNRDKIAFMGCMLKSMDAVDLGNIADADISKWLESMNYSKEFLKECKIFIPGHGDYGNQELLDHTIKLLNQNLENTNN